MFNSKPKIQVHIKEDPFDRVVSRRVETSSDGTKAYVVIEPETQKKAGWKVDVSGCIRRTKKGLYCEVIRGSNKAVKIDTENKQYTYSLMTNDEMKQFVNMNIFKAHYGKLLGDLLSAIKPYLIVFIVAVVVCIAISAYNTYHLTQIPVVTLNNTVPTNPGGVVG